MSRASLLLAFGIIFGPTMIMCWNTNPLCQEFPFWNRSGWKDFTERVKLTTKEVQTPLYDGHMWVNNSETYNTLQVQLPKLSEQVVDIVVDECMPRWEPLTFELSILFEGGPYNWTNYMDFDCEYSTTRDFESTLKESCLVKDLRKLAQDRPVQFVIPGNGTYKLSFRGKTSSVGNFTDIGSLTVDLPLEENSAN